MRAFRISLFFFGLLLAFAAFLGSQASNIPLVMKIVAPAYVNAQIGMQTLKQARILEPDDKGFSELAQLLHPRLYSPDNSQDVSQITIQRLTRGNPAIGFIRNSAGERIPIGVFLSNDQEFKLDISLLRKDVKTLQNNNLFLYSTIIFVIGALISCVSFIIEYRENKRLNKIIRSTG